MIAPGTDSHTTSTTWHASVWTGNAVTASVRHLAAGSFGVNIHWRADVYVPVDHAPDVDERLQAGHNEEDLHREGELAVVPVDHAHDGRLE